MKKSSFCERKFRSMLSASTLTLAIIYIMLLCDNIIAGLYIGTAGVAAINAITPVTGIVSFFSTIISIGTGIIYSREIGAMRKRRADEFFGQGLVISVGISAVTAFLLMVCKDVYFSTNKITGEVYELASAYYRWTPLNAVLFVMNSYLTKLVYTDGDEKSTNLSYAFQIGGNLLFSILLVRRFGMVGIILGTIIGNALGILIVCRHFFLKANTLHFVWHFSFADLAQAVRYSIVDAIIFFCWAVMDYVMIGHVSTRYGDMGEVTLAVIMGLLEFDIVLDGVGMAVQPLMEIYLGEKNQEMVRRLMRIALKAAIIEGLIANVLVFVFAKQFCFLFGIKGGAALSSSIHALRIVSTGLVFCSLISLLSAYYLVVDHVALSAGIIVLKDGLLYTFLPIIASVLLGENGMWAAFAISPLLATILTLLYIRLRYGAKRYPYLLEEDGNDIVILEDVLKPESCARLSALVSKAITERGHAKEMANHAALFTEEILLTALEKNKTRKRQLQVELSLLFDKNSVRLIERDNGEIFDDTDQNMRVDGFSSYVLSRMMAVHQEKVYLTTTGYNRTMVQFSDTVSE